MKVRWNLFNEFKPIYNIAPHRPGADVLAIVCAEAGNEGRLMYSSLLALYHRLIQLRRMEPALSVGDYSELPSGDDVMAYIRKASGRWLLIVLNFGAQARSFNLNDLRS